MAAAAALTLGVAAGAGAGAAHAAGPAGPGDLKPIVHPVDPCDLLPALCDPPGGGEVDPGGDETTPTTMPPGDGTTTTTTPSGSTATPSPDTPAAADTPAPIVSGSPTFTG
jgi:hypothetical protein